MMNQVEQLLETREIGGHSVINLRIRTVSTHNLLVRDVSGRLIVIVLA